ncbi:MAG: monovalent cation/H+ antiporter complex subunit F [Gammaproteobacteria bacterium]
MTADGLNTLEWIALLLLVAAFLLGMLRLLLGPAAGDRIVAADTLSIIVTGGIVGLAALYGNALYLDVALLYVALAFVGVVALARSLDGGHESKLASKSDGEGGA